MSDTAELVISCRGTGAQEVNRFTDAVRRADTASEKLLKTTGALFTTAQLLKFGRASLEAFKGAENASNSLRAALRKLSVCVCRASGSVNSFKTQTASSDDIERFRKDERDWEPRVFVVLCFEEI